jgi:hypothetical protein
MCRPEKAGRGHARSPRRSPAHALQWHSRVLGRNPAAHAGGISWNKSRRVPAMNLGGIGKIKIVPPTCPATGSAANRCLSPPSTAAPSLLPPPPYFLSFCSHSPHTGSCMLPPASALLPPCCVPGCLHALLITTWLCNHVRPSPSSSPRSHFGIFLDLPRSPRRQARCRPLAASATPLPPLLPPRRQARCRPLAASATPLPPLPPPCRLCHPPAASTTPLPPSPLPLSYRSPAAPATPLPPSPLPLPSHPCRPCRTPGSGCVSPCLLPAYPPVSTPAPLVLHDDDAAQLLCCKRCVAVQAFLGNHGFGAGCAHGEMIAGQNAIAF